MEGDEVKERDYGYWGHPHERIVYKSKYFVIMKYPDSRGGHGYEVIPIDERGARLDDIEICPEPKTFEKALQMMRERHNWIVKYRKNRRKR